MVNNTAPPSSIKRKAKKALEDWHKPNVGKSSLEELSLFRHYLQKTQQNHRRIANKILLEAIENLELEQPDCAMYLRQRYLDENSVLAVSLMRNISLSTAYELQKLAIEWLVSTLWDMEQVQIRERSLRMFHRLPQAEYVKLVGRENELKSLLKQLGASEGPYILSVTGIGGIGKTALTDNLIRRTVEGGLFDEIGWVTVKDRRLNFVGQIETVQSPAHSTETIIRELCLQLMPDFPLPTNFDFKAALNTLEKYLKQIPHLIFVDNLETLEDVRALIPTLQRLTNPTRFVLTSRETLHSEPNICHYPVPPLTEEHALNLIRQEATMSGLLGLAECSDEALLPIYETVGGNPLALRLVVGLAHHQDLYDVLDDLRGANNEISDQLYTYIYRQAWDKLSELDRQVLLTMSTIQPQGEPLEIVVQNSGLSKQDVRAALSSLVILNLVNSNGPFDSRRYRIHSLTTSFLLEQVLMWL